MPLTFFQLHFLHLQFLLVQILCKDMFFNVLLGNVVCVCVCVAEIHLQFRTDCCFFGIVFFLESFFEDMK